VLLEMNGRGVQEVDLSMKNKILYTLGFALFVVVLLGVMDARADSHLAAAPSVLESYACSYKPGKDREDLDKLKEFYLKQAGKAGIAAPDAWLWTLNKGSAPVDFVWLNVHENLTAFGGTDDAIAASPEMAEAFERADTVMTCGAGLGMFRQTYGGEVRESGSSVASFGCAFREGSGPSTIDGLHSQIGGLNELAGDLAVNSIFEVTPLTQGPDGADIVMVVITDGTSGWARHMDFINSIPEGLAAQNHFNAALDCDMNLWRLEQIVGGGD
jgi:hypothetical protein